MAAKGNFFSSLGHEKSLPEALWERRRFREGGSSNGPIIFFSPAKESDFRIYSTHWHVFEVAALN